jgi:aryl-alcohol dehydrogenase-like predicted oxidoreductase
MLPLCRSEGVGIIPWSPLARGRLARPWAEETYRLKTDEIGVRFYEGAEEGDRAILERVGEIATSRGVSRAQVALAWVLRQPGISAPIVGTSKPEHLDDAIAAIDLHLSDEEAERLEEPYIPHPDPWYI